MEALNGETDKVDGRALRWVKHREERTRKFIEITCEAVRKYSYQVSMDQIAEYAKTSKSILYRYFPDKLSLQYAVGSYVVGNLVQQIKEAMLRYENPAQMIKAAIEEYLDFMENNLDLYIFVRIGDLEGEPGSTKMLDFDEVILRTALDAHNIDVGKKADSLDNNLNSEQISLLVRGHIGSVALVSMIRNVAEAWLFSRRVLERPQDYPNFELSVSDYYVAQLSRDEVIDHIFVWVQGGVLAAFTDNESVTAN